LYRAAGRRLRNTALDHAATVTGIKQSLTHIKRILTKSKFAQFLRIPSILNLTEPRKVLSDIKLSDTRTRLPYMHSYRAVCTKKTSTESLNKIEIRITLLWHVIIFFIWWGGT
jgi:hypothetical protein